MDNRRQDRVPVEKPIVLTILGDPEIRLVASVKDASPRGIGVITEEALRSGAAVKIEIGDSIFLGEIMYCRPMDQRFFAGIELTQVLTGLAALSRLAQEFQEQLRPRSEVTPGTDARR
jgi:hypothetical protein